MDNFELFIPLYDITVLGGHESGLTLLPHMKLLYRDKKRKKIEELNKYVEYIGSLEMGSINNAPCLIHYTFNASYTFEQAEYAAYQACSFLNEILSKLWLIKECCPWIDQAFLINKTRNNIHANRAVERTSMSDGTINKNISFSYEELTLLKLKDITNPFIFDNDNEISINKLDGKSFTHSSISRIQRAIGFIQSARFTNNIPIKIAHYCSAFESLLSTGTGDLKYKISERSALFYEINTRKEIYNNVKEIYDVRSRILHGESVGKKCDVYKISKTADEILRAIIQQIFELDKQQQSLFTETETPNIEDFFINKVLQLA